MLLVFRSLEGGDIHTHTHTHTHTYTYTHTYTHNTHTHTHTHNTHTHTHTQHTYTHNNTHRDTNIIDKTILRNQAHVSGLTICTYICMYFQEQSEMFE